MFRRSADPPRGVLDLASLEGGTEAGGADRESQRQRGMRPLDRVEPSRPSAGDGHLAAVLAGADDDLPDAAGSGHAGIDEQASRAPRAPVASPELDDPAVALARPPLHPQRRG